MSIKDLLLGTDGGGIKKMLFDGEFVTRAALHELAFCIC